MKIQTPRKKYTNLARPVAIAVLNRKEKKNINEIRKLIKNYNTKYGGIRNTTETKKKNSRNKNNNDSKNNVNSSNNNNTIDKNISRTYSNNNISNSNNELIQNHKMEGKNYIPEKLIRTIAAVAIGTLRS